MSRTSYPAPPLPRAGQLRAWWRAPASPTALAWYLSQAARAHDAPLLVIARDNHSANQLEADLQTLLGGDPALPVVAFPDWETLPYDRFSPHPDIISQRLSALHRLPALKRGLVIVPVQTLLQQLAPRSYVIGGSFDLKVGQRLDLEAEKRRLESAGYRNVPQVMDPGDFAVRGGLLDVFPMGADEPLRVELLDEDIDSIRAFDPESQRSLDKVEAVHMLPGREVPMDEASIARVLATLRERFDVDTRRSSLYQDLKSGLAPAGVEYYLPLFFERTATLFDYLPDGSLPVVCTGAYEAAVAFWAQTGDRYEQRRHDVERPLLPPSALYLSPELLRERLNDAPRIEVWSADHARIADAHALGDQPLPPLPVAAREAPAGDALKSFLGHYPGRVLIAADSPGRREALLEVLQAAELKPPVVADLPSFLAGDARFAIAVAPLEDGFALDDPRIAVLTERQLFPERAGSTRRTRRAGREPEAIIRDLGELTEGAPIVHEDHGVGRYRGLIAMDVGGMPGEFLEIEYAKGDRLYVPVAQLHLISRYSGASAETAPLHSLGGEQWSKAKRKAAEKVRDVAAELLEIQARRQARAGLALQVDRAMYEPFAAGFPFEETPDQLAAIDATLRDLASSQPMDRVVCGDVGFGKTEVALRAAFIAAMEGFQVAVVVPTTLLSRQHFKTFSQRFSGLPIRVRQASRLVGAKELAETKKGIADGTVDIVVGTHALLGSSISFKNLGLLIIDEEQHFGVKHKERLKELKSDVHVLTLSATPIPRTLQLALTGVRELSLIATPPVDRMAVRTFISPFDPLVIRETLLRERYRGGHSFYVVPRISDLSEIHDFLKAEVPELKVAVAHGQMPPGELDDIMNAFYDGQYDVLLSTTIVESGLDIPTANTLIVHRADMFGLAQLYQLRGRVGRSKVRAYALFSLPANKKLTDTADRRLKVLQSLDTLGAGFQLASHDLDIRGAGNLLGEEQSGHIKEVGFELYQQMLEEAVAEVKDSGEVADTGWSPQITVGTAVMIPEGYVPDLQLRLALYRRLGDLETTEEIDAFGAELIDRFGPLPEEVKHLLKIVFIKALCRKANVEKLDAGPKGVVIQFRKKEFSNPVALVKFIGEQGSLAKIRPDQSVVFTRDWPTAEKRLAGSAVVMTQLAKLAV